MATPDALTAADDLTGVVVYSPWRGARQLRTFHTVAGIAGGIGVVLAIAALIVDSGLWVLAVFALVIAAIGFGVSLLFRRQIGRRTVGFSPRGIFVPQLPAPIGWDEIAWLTAARFDNRVGGGPGGRMAAAAMAGGGVNDGGRELYVVLARPEEVERRLGALSILMSPLLFEEDGAQGFSIPLSNATDEAAFLRFGMELKAEADARGIPFRVMTR